MSPCIWSDADGYGGARRFLHESTIGRFIVDSFWKILGNDVITLNKYDSHPETAKLKPWTNPFFIAASGLSILNYDTDFFELIKRGGVHIHVTDIDHLSKDTVHLTNGSEVPAGALVVCSGWKHTPPLTFLPWDLDLGLPGNSNSSDLTPLIKEADSKTFASFPRLVSQPPPNPKARPALETPTHEPTSYNLYRFMIPPSTTNYRDIAFAGSLMSVATSLIAQTQALWICAYFNLQLRLPDEEDLLYETVLHNRFGKWRYPSGYGANFPDFVFDAVPYLDMLLRDLGLKRWRKGGAVKEALEAYGPEDYKNLVGEWLEVSNKQDESKKNI